MDFETLIRDEQSGLTRSLTAILGGDRHAAEDLRQEAFVRAWRRLPRDLEPRAQRAWLRRTAEHLAIDELRRRGRRPSIDLDSAGEIAAAVRAPEPEGAREALARLDPHERFVLLLRFNAGLRHAEIARLLDITEEAARKRVARARRSFVTAYRAVRSNPTPVVLVIARDESVEPYVRWIEHAGAQPREAPARPSERDLVLADALLLTGAFRDVHSSLYGEAPRLLRGEPDLETDRGDLALLRGALSLDMPIVGICRGHQLLNIVTGGSLYQDVVADGLTDASHDDGCHLLRTDGDTATRRLIGRSPEVDSSHHQAIRRLGRGLRPTARSRDGVIEMIERQDRRFALGMQWHPEQSGERGDAIAEAMVAAIGAAA
jgi:RNA polymerase sigma factor (sigma-70 family)